jgi:hypothetical protein
VSWILLAIGAGLGRALADPAAISVTYAAPSECASEAEVRARLADHAMARDSSTVPAVDVTITHGADGFRGEMSLRVNDKPPAMRTVTGASCDEVVTALVLVATLAIETRAPRAPAEPRAVESPPAVHALPVHFALASGVARYVGVTPSPRVGVPISIAARRGGQELRVTFDVIGRDEGAMATFRWTAGRVQACPFVLRFGALEASPCAGVQVGALTGQGMTADAATDTQPWIAPELAARLAVVVGPARVEVEAAAAAPLFRDHYYIAPATTVHRTARVVSGLGAGLAVDFW